MTLLNVSIKLGFAVPVAMKIGSKLAKGQIISKCLFGDFNFLQKMNENKST